MTNPRWKKVIADLWENKSRTLLVVMSIAVGVVAFGGLFLARHNLLHNLSLQYNRVNSFDIAISFYETFDDELVRWAERQDYVEEAQGIAVYSAELVIRGDTYNMTVRALEDFENPQIVTGDEEKLAEINQITVVSGKQWLDRNEFWLERSYLARSGLEYGEQVQLELENGNQYTFTFVGTVHDLNVESGAINEELQIYTTPRTLHSIDLDSRFNQLYLTVERSAFGLTTPGPTEIADKLRYDLTLMGLDVGTITVNEPPEHWATTTLDGLVTMLFFFGSFSLLLSGFLVVNTISGFMAQQTKQIGIMKIIGASREQIIVIYMVMVAVFGLLALIVAMPTSILLGYFISNVLTPLVNFDIIEFEILPEILILEVAVSFLAPLLSALSPVMSGTQISAAQAISDYNAASRNNILDIALSKIQGLPRPFLISLRNMFRKKGRLLMTVVTLVLAGAFFIGVLNLRQGFQNQIRTDAVRMSNYDVQLSLGRLYNREGIEKRVGEVDGVLSSEGWMTNSVSRVRPNNERSENIIFIGLPYNSIFIDPEMEDGRWLSESTRENRYDIVVTKQFLEDEPDLQVGDFVTLSLTDGKEEDWRIVGMIDSFDESMIYAHYDTASQFLGMPDLINSVLIRGVDAKTLETQNELEDTAVDYLDERDYAISSSETSISFINNIIGVFDTIIFLLVFIAVMIAIVGGLGLAGTMSLSVLERTREIGVMRSVGATTNTLRFMFIAEGVMIGFLSSVIAFTISTQVGIGLGRLLGSAMFGSAFDAAFDPAALLIWLVIVIVISTVASVMPAQRASQISIREALSYE